MVTEVEGTNKHGNRGQGRRYHGNRGREGVTVVTKGK